MAEITPGDLDLEVDIAPTAEMSNHAQQHNAANKAIVDLVNELGGEVDVDGNINIEGGLAGGVPAPKPEDKMKVLATDGNLYDWARLTTEYLPLADPQRGIEAFGITDEPANTQQEANTAFYRWIDINTNSIEGVADALGLSITIENDNIIIGIDPNNDGILDVSNKFDKGDGVLEYETAVILGQAVKKNEGSISTNAGNITINSNNFASLLAELNLTIDGEGNITPGAPDPSNPLDISGKFDKGPDSDLARARIYDNAAKMEAAIKGNASEIGALQESIKDIVDPEGNITLDGYFPKYVEGDTEQDALIYPAASVMGTAVAKNLDDIATEKSARIAGDENALEEVAKKYDAGVVPENEARTYPDAYALEQAVEANADNISTNATNIEAVVEVLGGDIENIENIQIDALPPQTGADGKFLTTDGSKASWGDVPSDDAKFNKGATTYEDAAAMEEAIKSLGEKGYDDTWIQPALDNKFDKGTGDLHYADAVILGQAVKANKEDITTNTNAIGVNTGDITSLSNRLDALENTSLSSEWTIRVDGGGPEAGEISLNSDVWADVTVLKISTTDAEDGTHDFSNVKVGDTIQIGVGASGRAAGSSAAYTVDSVAGGEFGVTHLASTGSPTAGFTAVIAVYPAFDPSNYATTSELEAVEAAKLSKGDGLVAANAKVLEDAINTNAGDISTNATNISNNASAILENTTNIESVIEVIGGNVDIDGNITLPDPIDIDSKLDKGTGLVAKDAKELEDAIGTNATNIETNKTNINSLVEVIGGTTEGGEIVLPDPINIDSKFDAGDVPDGQSRTYDDAYALEQAVLANALAIEGIDIPEGQQNVTVSEELPAAADGDNGDWWIYTPPAPSGFAIDYSNSINLGTWSVSYSGSSNPEMGKAHMSSNAGASVDLATLHINNTDKNGESVNPINSWSPGMFLHLETKLNLGNGAYSEVKYKIRDVEKLSPTVSKILLDRVFFDGTSNWNDSLTYTIFSTIKNSFVGNFYSGITFSSGSFPSAGKINSNKYPNSASESTHVCSTLVKDPSGKDINITDFVKTWEVGDILRYECYDNQDIAVSVKYEITEAPVVQDTKYTIKLNPIEPSNLTSWVGKPQVYYEPGGTTEPEPGPEIELENYEPGALLGKYTQGVTFNSGGGTPATNSIIATMQPMASWSGDHIANSLCTNENGGPLDADFWLDLEADDIVYYKVYSQADGSMIGAFAYKVLTAAISAGNNYATVLQSMEGSGISNWDTPNVAEVYVGVDLNAVEPPPEPEEPEEQGNTLFYKDNDAWLQIGGTSGGGGSYDDSELREAINTNADAIEAVDKSKVSFAINENDANLFCNKIVTLTQAEYDALTDRDPNTLYLAV